MALTRDDLVGAIAKLNELTRQKAIEWQQCPPPSKPPISANALIGNLEARSSFEATHEDRLLRITEYTVTPTILSTGRSAYRYVLEVMDEDRKSCV